MTLILGKYLEIEAHGFDALYVRVGNWERFYNRLGLPDGTWK